MLLPYLQLKVITFTKIQDDYYCMSALPESKLENFKAALVSWFETGLQEVLNGLNCSRSDLAILGVSLSEYR